MEKPVIDFFKKKSRSFPILLCAIFFFGKLSSAQDTMTLLNYNMLNFPSSHPERIHDFKRVFDFLHPDILILNEVTNGTAADLLLDSALNLSLPANFESAPFFDGLDSDNLLLFNSDKVKLHSYDTIPTALRLINEYKLLVNDPNLSVHSDSTFLDIFSLHLKAGQGQQNEDKRAAESLILRNYLEGINSWQNIFVSGDFNIFSSGETAWENLANATNRNLFDPINEIGNWHNNVSFSHTHTQSTRAISLGGGASGGLDDRFDMILISEDILNGENRVSFVNGSYAALGNDGQHFNVSILDAPNHPELPSNVMQSLYNASDHLPVVLKVAINFPEIPCAVPQNHEAINITSQSARLIWDVVLSAEKYELRGNRIGVGNFVTMFVNGAQNYLYVPGLSSSTTYVWQIRAICDETDSLFSDWSAFHSFSTPQACTIPWPISTTNILSAVATLNWNPVNGAEGYELRGRKVGGPWINISLGNVSSYVVHGLEPLTQYEWKVKAKCEGGNSGFTGLVSFGTLEE